MPHARVLDFLQGAAHMQRKPGRSQLVISKRPRSTFHGLFIAMLLAAAFWAGLVLLILRLD